MLFKFGQSFEITEANILAPESVLSDPEIVERFSKFAGELKRIAPKANDFLYFSAIFMHAAEASLINQDGSPKMLGNGKKAEAHWDISNDSYKWTSNDPSVKPFKNSNGDIFPESQLLTAYKKWIGKPLCLDHKSSSVDFVRGIIVDTYYDHVNKRVIGLCALDKINYPDLARKVSTGYATSVSMGTSVGRAVCTDCGKVARTEQDFCNHMRTKSGYGEINLDLNPIELSIVVNGADPFAKIKHIIASADALNQYAESKQTELKTLSSTDASKVEAIRDSIVNGIKTGLDSLISEFSNVNNIEATAADTALPIQDIATESGQRPVQEATEPNKALIDQFNELKSSIELKLGTIQQDFNRLLNLGESNMTTKIDKNAYFQGGGDVNEPAPKAVKYEKDPLNEKLRENGDKQMVQQDMGPVDGMHPGTESSGMDELARKKMLARAEVEERSARRKLALTKAQDILKKQSYFQGGDETPTPGKSQYPVDPMNEKVRNKEDKQMQGQPPFPGVGAVDGLHPSPASADEKDELKRKEMLGRASLKLKFVKAMSSDGQDDRANSAWQVFANDKLVLTASVAELSAGRVDALYDVIATRDFGSKMLGKIKEVGFEKAATLYKRAAEPMAPAAPAAAAQPEAAADVPDFGGSPAGDADPLAGAKDAAEKGGSGNAKENVIQMVDELKELVPQRLADIKEGITNLEGEKAEMLESAPGDAAAPKMASSLNKMRIELNATLTNELKKNANDLIDHKEELGLVSDLFDSNSVTDENQDYVINIATDAVAEARATLAETMDLFSIFVKYAKGTEAMMKRAEMIKNANEMGLETPEEEAMEAAGLGLDGDELNEAKYELDDEHLSDDAFSLDGLEEMMVDDTMPDQLDADVSKKDLSDLPVGTKIEMPQGGVTVTAEFDLTTKAGRTAYRAKIASETVKWAPILGDAHKHITDVKLDVKPSGDLGHIESREEQHKQMLEVATQPVKVRKEAEEIMKLVKAGKLDPKEVDNLVSHGVDPEAVKFWKTLWKEVEGGNEFASELVKEYAKKKASEEIETHKVKLSRAYDLAFQMVSRGMVQPDHAAIVKQVDEIMQFNDQAFTSLKRVVASHAPKMVKEAGRLPVVGLYDSTSEPTSNGEPDFNTSLAKAFANRKY